MRQCEKNDENDVPSPNYNHHSIGPARSHTGWCDPFQCCRRALPDTTTELRMISEPPMSSTTLPISPRVPSRHTTDEDAHEWLGNHSPTPSTVEDNDGFPSQNIIHFEPVSAKRSTTPTSPLFPQGLTMQDTPHYHNNTPISSLECTALPTAHASAIDAASSRMLAPDNQSASSSLRPLEGPTFPSLSLTGALPSELNEKKSEKYMMGIMTPRSSQQSLMLGGGPPTPAQALEFLETLKSRMLHLSEEQKLLEAWTQAEYCLRYATRFSDRAESPMTVTNIAQGGRRQRVFLVAWSVMVFIQACSQFINEFTSDATYIAITTKIRLLFDIFAIFDLEERFSKIELRRDSSAFWFSRGSRLASKDTDSETQGSPRDLIGPSASQLEPGGRTNGFFRRKVSLMSKSRIGRRRRRSRELPVHVAASKKAKTTEFLLNGLHVSRSAARTLRYSLRGGYYAGHPPRTSSSNGQHLGHHTLTTVATTGNPWVEDYHRGLYVAHRVNPNGSIVVRIHAKMRVPLFQLLAILYETTYYDRWVPFCKRCDRVAEISKVSMIIQQICDYPWPVKQKENLSFCFGVDALDDFGCVVIASYGFSENATSFMGYSLPPPTKKIPRVPSSSFLFLLTPLDEGKATHFEVFAMVDPAVNSASLKSVVMPILKFIVLRSVRGFFHKIGSLASHFESSDYAARVQGNPELYEWIKGRIQDVVVRNKVQRGDSNATLCFDELK